MRRRQDVEQKPSCLPLAGRKRVRVLPPISFFFDGWNLVMWRNSLDGNRDMYLAKSRDGGEAFGSPRRLGADNWQLAACPMDVGALAVDESGVIHTAWRRTKRFTLRNRKEKEKAV